MASTRSLHAGVWRVTCPEHGLVGAAIQMAEPKADALQVAHDEEHRAAALEAAGAMAREDRRREHALDALRDAHDDPDTF